MLVVVDFDTAFAGNKRNGYIFDGTCNGDGRNDGPKGQEIVEILKTVTVEVVVVEVYPAGPVSVTSIQTGWPTAPVVTVTVTSPSAGHRSAHVISGLLASSCIFRFIFIALL